MSKFSVDRWQSLAGIKNSSKLDERREGGIFGNTNHVDMIIQSMMTGNKKKVDAMGKALSKLSHEEQKDLDNPENKKKLMDEYEKAQGPEPGKVNNFVDGVLGGRFSPPKNPEAEKTFNKVQAYVDAIKQGKTPPPLFDEVKKEKAEGKEEKVDDIRKKYATSFEKVTKTLKDTDPEEIAKVFSALDSMKVFKLKEG